MDYKESTRKIYFHEDRLLFKYANDIKENQMVPTSYIQLMENYEINQEQFLIWLDLNNIEYVKDQIEVSEDWEFISNRIKAEIANVLWGRKAFYKALTYNDLQVKIALDQFVNAEKLLNQK